MNIAPNTYKGDGEFKDNGPTYQDDANLMLGLAIIQIVFFSAQCCCCWIPLYTTPVKDAEYDKKREARKVNKIYVQQI